MSASVKVMRSYDYCHFEVCLGSEEIAPYSDQENAIIATDKMRKDAMRLVDKAIEQYKIARNLEQNKSGLGYEYQRLKDEVQDIKENYPQNEWNPEQKAKVKRLRDLQFQMNREYDYEDDYEEDFEV